MMLVVLYAAVMWMARALLGTSAPMKTLARNHMTCFVCYLPYATVELLEDWRCGMAIFTATTTYTFVTGWWKPGAPVKGRFFLPFGENWEPCKGPFCFFLSVNSGLLCGSGLVQASESFTVAGWQSDIAAELSSSRQQGRGWRTLAISGWACCDIALEHFHF
jgi:hypothetical protein